MPLSEASQLQPDGLWTPSSELRAAVAVVCDRDPTLHNIEAETGPLRIRRWPPGFASLVRIILGQQLSSRAAEAIFQRLIEHLELTPANLAIAPDLALQQVGLSRAKIATCHRLSAAILAGQVNLEALSSLSDVEATEQLTQIKGIGLWTAEIYLLFCLERLSSFPASDLAVQIGYQLLKNLEARPTRKTLLALTENLHPYRGALAHLLWHYYRQTNKKKK